METQYKYDNGYDYWRQNEDGTVTLSDARCILGPDISDMTIPETILSEDGSSELLVTGVASWAFDHCPFVRHIHLSKNITLKGAENFGYNLKLVESVTVSEDNPELASKDGVLYVKNFPGILYWPPAKTDFSSLNRDTRFAWHAFVHAQINHDSFPADIREKLNMRMWNLHEEDMTADPVYLVDFMDKDGNVFVPEYVVFGGRKYSVKRILAPEEFYDDFSFKNIFLPNTVEYISDMAFCRSYRDSPTGLYINIPDNVRCIGNSAFISLFGRQELDLPASLEKVGIAAFIFNKTVKRIVIPRGIKDAGFIFDFCNLEEIVLKDSLSGEENIVLVDGVLFTADMKTLLKYPAGKKDEYYKVPDCVERIEYFAFANNKYLQEVVLPDQLKDLDRYDDSAPVEGIPSYINISYEDFSYGNCWYEVFLSFFSGCINLKKIVGSPTVTDIVKLPECLEEESVDLFFRCKELNIVFHRNKEGNLYAKMLNKLIKTWDEDYFDEESGVTFTIPRGEVISENNPVEIHLAKDSITSYRWAEYFEEYFYGTYLLETITEEEYLSFGQNTKNPE